MARQRAEEKAAEAELSRKGQEAREIWEAEQVRLAVAEAQQCKDPRTITRLVRFRGEEDAVTRIEVQSFQVRCRSRQCVGCGRRWAAEITRNFANRLEGKGPAYLLVVHDRETLDKACAKVRRAGGKFFSVLDPTTAGARMIVSTAMIPGATEITRAEAVDRLTAAINTTVARRGERAWGHSQGWGLPEDVPIDLDAEVLGVVEYAATIEQVKAAVAPLGEVAFQREVPDRHKDRWIGTIKIVEVAVNSTEWHQKNVGFAMLGAGLPRHVRLSRMSNNGTLKSNISDGWDIAPPPSDPSGWVRDTDQSDHPG
jgi:hypothetical protein